MLSGPSMLTEKMKVAQLRGWKYGNGSKKAPARILEKKSHI